MTPTRVAILGGDRRELWIAHRLQEAGHSVALFGVGMAAEARDVERPASAAATVQGAQWILTPSPGLGPGDRIYAPTHDGDLVLDADLLTQSEASRGGVVLGRASATLSTAAAQLGVALFEMKDHRALAIINATAVAEAIIALVIEQTDRVLGDHHVHIVGYGATGAPMLDRFVSLGCDVSVAARRPELLERIRQSRGHPIEFNNRVAAMADADIVLNTVPDPLAVPPAAFPVLAGRLLIDISSPPGGVDHDAATRAGVRVNWARGLAGKRAPLTAGDAQFRFLQSAIEGAVAPTTAHVLGVA